MKKSILFALILLCSNVWAIPSIQNSEETSYSTIVPRIQKLKRKLLRNLVKDDLINSKKEFVRIDLPKGQIIVNGKAIEGELYRKYNSIFLNHDIQHGEKRGIHISPYFIKVGDFDGECFKGHASGRVELKLCDDEKNSRSLFLNRGEFKNN